MKNVTLIGLGRIAPLASRIWGNIDNCHVDGFVGYAIANGDDGDKVYFSREEKGYKFFPIMAPIAEGTRELINYVAAELQKLPAIKVYDAEAKPVEDFTVKKKRTFNIRACDGVFFVEDAPWLLDVMNQVDPNDYESLQYFERVLRSSGIIDALQAAGVREGDTVSVYDVEFDYVS